jgi:metal-dependent amidase/aminoacylase/carboxypeptidase family protein
MAVHAQRETFQDKDHIRVHPIITKGGDLVNVVPADVRVETYVRGATVDAILDASEKVNRAFRAGGYAVDVETKIIELPGYLPTVTCPGLEKLMTANLIELLGEAKVDTSGTGISGSTDAGDISHLIPTIQASIGGASGIGHSESYEIADKELAYLTAAKALIMTVIDLLADGAEEALKIKKSFVPVMTKAQYLKDWGKIE